MALRSDKALPMVRIYQDQVFLHRALSSQVSHQRVNKQTFPVFVSLQKENTSQKLAILPQLTIFLRKN